MVPPAAAIDAGWYFRLAAIIGDISVQIQPGTTNIRPPNLQHRLIRFI
jgi:hypothetical protein